MPRAIASTRRAYRPKRISNAPESFDCRRAITSSSLGERSPAAFGAGAESSWLGLQAMGNVKARPCGGELMRSSQFRGITLHLQRDTPCTGAPPPASSDAFRNIHHLAGGVRRCTGCLAEGAAL